MSRTRKKAKGKSPSTPQLPKNALSRINLGASFAEYDKVLRKTGVFVTTPAARAAGNVDIGKCFFVGRRGTGKTAITQYLQTRQRAVRELLPELDLLTAMIDGDSFRDTRQRPFKSLLCACKRALALEVVRDWQASGQINDLSLDEVLLRQRTLISDFDFDQRLLELGRQYVAGLAGTDEDWLSLVREATQTSDSVERLHEGRTSRDLTLVIDRVDESWDGSEEAVVVLMALMHAAVELSARTTAIQVKLFLRENIFERVRSLDNEFARLETSIVSLDWTSEQLLELVERRLGHPFNTKMPLHGPTWDCFFESNDGFSSQSHVFDFCQHRPRDVIIYTSFAVESAVARLHSRVLIEDLQDARQRFSDSRLKDLGDEYAENFPQLQLVLARFFGLGTRFSLPGIVGFIQKLLCDSDVTRYCKSWIHAHATPERFVTLLYNIGFAGLSDGAAPSFRSAGAMTSTPPPISASTEVVIHPSYHPALNLRDVVITELDNAVLQVSGVLSELPEATIDRREYHDQLEELLASLTSLPTGTNDAAAFEDLVGSVLRLCFFTTLCNVKAEERTVDGCCRRDWIVSNRAPSGFWEMVRSRYSATQVVWECKNYDTLKADDFHQISYYLNEQIGKFGVIVFRGKIKPHDYDHVSRIAKDKGVMVLILSHRDLMVFVRQAIKGKAKEDHIRNIYDKAVRAIS